MRWHSSSLLLLFACANAHIVHGTADESEQLLDDENDDVLIKAFATTSDWDALVRKEEDVPPWWLDLYRDFKSRIDQTIIDSQVAVRAAGDDIFKKMYDEIDSTSTEDVDHFSDDPAFEDDDTPFFPDVSDATSAEIEREASALVDKWPNTPQDLASGRLHNFATTQVPYITENSTTAADQSSDAMERLSTTPVPPEPVTPGAPNSSSEILDSSNVDIVLQGQDNVNRPKRDYVRRSLFLNYQKKKKWLKRQDNRHLRKLRTRTNSHLIGTYGK